MKDKITVIGKTIVILIGNQCIIRLLDNIRFCEACKHYVEFYFNDGEVILVLFKISNLAKILPESMFYNCHRRFIVHLILPRKGIIKGNKIMLKHPVINSLYDKNKMLTDGEILENKRIHFIIRIIPISKNRKNEFIERAEAFSPGK